MKPSVIFRLEIYPDMGLGNFRRCQILAEGFRDSGLGEAAFLVSERSRKFVHLIEENGLNATIIPAPAGSEADLEFTLKILKTHPSILVTDNPLLSKSYLNRAGQEAELLFIITDHNRFPFPADIVLNQTIYAPLLKHRSSDRDTIFLLGARYFLMPGKLKALAEKMTAKEFPPKNILVVMGGSDSVNLTGALLKALDLCRGDFTVTALIGPMHEHRDQVESAASKMKKSVNLISGAANIWEIMVEADFALSAAGVTALELSALGVPTLLFPQNRGERLNAYSLRVAGAASVFDSELSYERIFPPEKMVDEISRQALRLMTDEPRLAGMHEAAGGIFDGCGLQRVLKAVEVYLTHEL